MPEDEKEIEQPDRVLSIVEKILDFNRKIPEQQGFGLKILAQNQMLSESPITLAQLNAENNSEKLENEIRQILHSLYRSKKLTKNIYNNLINAI